MLVHQVRKSGRGEGVWLWNGIWWKGEGGRDGRMVGGVEVGKMMMEGVDDERGESHVWLVSYPDYKKAILERD